MGSPPAIHILNNALGTKAADVIFLKFSNTFGNSDRNESSSMTDDARFSRVLDLSNSTDYCVAAGAA